MYGSRGVLVCRRGRVRTPTKAGLRPRGLEGVPGPPLPTAGSEQFRVPSCRRRLRTPFVSNLLAVIEVGGGRIIGLVRGQLRSHGPTAEVHVEAVQGEKLERTTEISISFAAPGINRLYKVHCCKGESPEKLSLAHNSRSRQEATQLSRKDRSAPPPLDLQWFTAILLEKRWAPVQVRGRRQLRQYCTPARSARPCAVEESSPLVGKGRCTTTLSKGCLTSSAARSLHLLRVK